MCGGSKGQSSQSNQTAQTQTYTPNPQTTGYLTNAMDRAATTANLPFNVPQAPVAGFSQDQQGAFQRFRDLQGTAQPYYNQAANIYGQTAQGPNISQFFNPYAGAVGASMEDLFGQQRSQNTGDLVKAAGGVGADRIGVGQSELAKQQGLSLGQTMASLYAPSLQAALQQQGVEQNAASGLTNIGNASQGSALQGANALLGTGGLEQQLSQAQLNSPYQRQVAQAAFPYQQAQFLAGTTASLAPGFGGTTSGTGTSAGTAQAPAPSIFSQLLGAGAAATGAYKTFGGTGNGKGSNTGTGDGSWYGPSSVGGAPLSARGGRIHPYAEGGGVPTDPIDISHLPFIPNVQLQPMQPHIPQVNLAPPQQPQQQQQSGGGPGIADLAKIAAMFASGGGRVESPFQPMADGGTPSMEDRFGPTRDALADGSFDTVGANNTTFDGTPGMASANSGTVPLPRARPAAPDTAMAFAGPDEPESEAVSAINAYAPTGRAGSRPAASAADAPQSVSPYSQPAASSPDAIPSRDSGPSSNPWTALMAAGLGMMGGTSPYAGVNIGQGGMQGIKMLEAQRAAAQKDETADQSARRLAQEARFHEDAYTRQTANQKAVLAQQKELSEAENYAAAGSIMTKDGLHPAFYDKKSARVIDGITGKPPEVTDHVIPKGGSRNSPEEIASVVKAIKTGEQPPVLTGLYGDGIHVRAGLAADGGFDLTKAQMEWKAAEKQIAALNGPQMQRGYQLYRSVVDTIGEVKSLSQEMKLGGVPFLNSLELQNYIKAQGNSPNGILATRYMTAVNTLKEEFANLANGGYAPTEPAWKLANEQVNGNYGVKQLGASLDEIERLINYRMRFTTEGVGPGAANRYTGNQGTGNQGTGGTRPASGLEAQTKRFNALIGGGKTEEEAYSIMREEGYK